MAIHGTTSPDASAASKRLYRQFSLVTELYIKNNIIVAQEATGW